MCSVNGPIKRENICESSDKRVESIVDKKFSKLNTKKTFHLDNEQKQTDTSSKTSVGGR